MYLCFVLDLFVSVVVIYHCDLYVIVRGDYSDQFDFISFTDMSTRLCLMFIFVKDGDVMRFRQVAVCEALFL